MTAEIAVLNKFGVALAADSAITVDVYHNRKIKRKVHNSANKLFALSKYQPVGIMFYNTVSLSGVPWETIIKIYRRQLRQKAFDTIEEYGADFFKWLSTANSFFAADQEYTFVDQAIMRIYVDLDPQQKLTKQNFHKEVDKRIADLEKEEDLVLPNDFEKHFLKKYGQDVIEAAEVAFKKTFLNGAKTKLKHLVSLNFSKKIKSNSYSGIVIAGFGETQSLPHLVEYSCDLMVLDLPRWWQEKSYSIGEDNSSEVVPLADSEVIETLIKGISPGFENEAYESVLKLLLALPKKIVDPIVELTEAQKQKYIGDAMNALPQRFAEFYKGISAYRNENYTVPIKQAIASLPVSELAQVAESFLGASQVLKKVNPDLETVGGPVDVAVISKGDGFVWIKRKHYFTDEFNPAFRLRYLEQ